MGRVILRDVRTPFGGSFDNSSGDSSAYARLDHVHELFNQWEDVPLLGDWTGTFRLSKASDLVCMDLTVQNVGAPLAIFAVIPELFRPVADTMLVAAVRPTGSIVSHFYEVHTLIVAANGDTKFNSPGVGDLTDLIDAHCHGIKYRCLA